MDWMEIIQKALKEINTHIFFLSVFLSFMVFLYLFLMGICISKESLKKKKLQPVPELS